MESFSRRIGLASEIVSSDFVMSTCPAITGLYRTFSVSCIHYLLLALIYFLLFVLVSTSRPLSLCILTGISLTSNCLSNGDLFQSDPNFDLPTSLAGSSLLWPARLQSQLPLVTTDFNTLDSTLVSKCNSQNLPQPSYVPLCVFP